MHKSKSVIYLLEWTVFNFISFRASKKWICLLYMPMKLNGQLEFFQNIVNILDLTGGNSSGLYIFLCCKTNIRYLLKSTYYEFWVTSHWYDGSVYCPQ